MSVRTATLAMAACAALAAGRAAGQPGSAPPPGAGQPPVLSSTPTLPPGAQTEPAQMSGMPLQVGDLPPGTVAVRVIRKTFGQNVVNASVELQVGGASAARSSVTDPEGRAIFQGLRVGDVVRTQTVVDGEALASQSFQLPAQGGVRLVLVAGVGARVPTSQVQAFEPVPGAPDAPVNAPPGGASVAIPTSAPTVTRVAQADLAGQPRAADPWLAGPAAVTAGLLVAAAAGGFWWLRGAPRRSALTRQPRAPQRRSDAMMPAAPFMSESVDTPEPPDLGARDRLFVTLVALEREQASGQSKGGDYQTRRQALIDAIVRLDASSE